MLTNDAALAERARCLRNYGRSSLYEHTKMGLNSRLDELQAALLESALLPRLDDWLLRRRLVAETYNSEIVNPLVETPSVPAECSPSWHLYPVRVAPESRQAFIKYLWTRGILSGIHYPETDTPSRRNAGGGPAGGSRATGGRLRRLRTRKFRCQYIRFSRQTK